MRALSLATSTCQWFARVLSFAVSFFGLFSFLSADFRRDVVPMSLYCVLPVLSFPVTLLSFRSLRGSVALHLIVALGYLAAYSILDWRTCSELGYCHGVASTVLDTMTAQLVQALFAVAALNLALLILKRKLMRTQGAAS